MLKATTCEFYKSRLEYHTGEVLRYLAVESEPQSIVTNFRRLLTKDTPSYSLVEFVDDLFTSPNFRILTERISKPGQARNLVRQLRFLHRPWNAYTIFGDTANRLPSFQTVRIILLPGFAERRISPDSTFAKPMHARTKLLAPAFFRIAEKPKWVHAEIRMATYLLSHPKYKGHKCYLGISKKTCFSCGHVLKELGMFTTRGNHGKVYAQWTLPISLNVEPRYVGSLDKATENVKARLLEALQSSTSKQLVAVKESSITTPVTEPRSRTNIFQEFILDPRDLQREADWLRRSRPTNPKAR